MYAPPLLPDPMIENVEAARAVAARYAAPPRIPREAVPGIVAAVVFIAFGIALGLGLARTRL